MDAISFETLENEVEKEKPKSSEWRVPLLRALVQGKLADVVRICSLHPMVIHQHFTREMHNWELEWESTAWYVAEDAAAAAATTTRLLMDRATTAPATALPPTFFSPPWPSLNLSLRYEFTDSTPLYVASSHGHVDIVEWLVSVGSNPGDACFAKLTPNDVAGQFGTSCPEGVGIAVSRIRDILKRDPKPPPPPDVPSAMASLEQMTREQKQKASDIGGEVARTCRCAVSWKSGFMPPHTVYEIQYREVGKEGLWSIESVPGLSRTIVGLESGASYDFQTRAKGPAGWSNYSEILTVPMPKPKKPKPTVQLDDYTKYAPGAEEAAEGGGGGARVTKSA